MKRAMLYEPKNIMTVTIPGAINQSESCREATMPLKSPEGVFLTQ